MSMPSQSIPAHHAFSHPKPPRPPLRNPYDQLTAPEFDAFIGDITSALRRALGRDDDNEPPSRPPERTPDMESRGRLSGHHLFNSDDSDDEPAEDSFAQIKARRAVRTGDFPEGKGDRNQPIEIVSSDEEDAQEVELSMLSLGLDDEEQEDARSYSDEEEDGYPWEQGQSSSQVSHLEKPVLDHEETYEDELEEDQKDEQGHYNEYESEGEEEYDEEEEDPRAANTMSEEIIEIVDSDDEQEFIAQIPRTAEAEETEEVYDEDQEQENYTDNFRIGTSHLVRPDHGLIRRPREYANEKGGEKQEQEDMLEQEHEVAEDGNEFEDIQPVDIDTSFPPNTSLSPAESRRRVELPDPWSGPRTYAEDFYSGGDVRVSPDVRVDAHHLGPMDDRPVEGIETISSRQDEDPNVIQPMNEDTSFPPHQHETDPAADVDLPDPWDGPKTYAEDFYSGGDFQLSRGGQLNAHYLGPTDVDYAEDVERHTVLEIELGDSDSMQPFEEDTSSTAPQEVLQEERNLPVELPDPWAGPRTYAEDFYSGGDVQPLPGYQIDPALLSGSADADDSIDNFLTPGVISPNQSEERTSTGPDISEQQGNALTDENQPPDSQFLSTAAGRRTSPVPAVADVINVDDSDGEEEAENNEGEGVAASSDIGDDEDLNFMYPEFDEPQIEGARDGVGREETKEQDISESRNGEDRVVVPSSAGTSLAASEPNEGVGFEKLVHHVIQVETNDFLEIQEHENSPESGLQTIEDEQEGRRASLEPEEHQTTAASYSPPFSPIHESHLPEAPDYCSALHAARETSIDIVEEEVDQLQNEAAAALYVLPAEVVEPETASEYADTVDEGSAVEVGDAEIEVEVPVPAHSFPRESEQTAEPEQQTVTEMPVDATEDEFDDMYMAEPPTEVRTEETVSSPIEAEPAAMVTELESLEQMPDEEMPTEAVVDVEVHKYEFVSDVDSTQMMEEDIPVPGIPHDSDNVPEVEFQDSFAIPPQPEPEEQGAGHMLGQPHDESFSGPQLLDQLPTPPSERSHFIPLPSETDREGKEPAQSLNQKVKSRVEIEDIPEEDPLTRPVPANAKETIVGASLQKKVTEYSVEEVEEYSDDDADGEYYEEDQERDISLMSVTSATDMLRRWDEDREGHPELEESLTEGRLTEEPREREMSLGVVSITSEAAAAFQEGRVQESHTFENPEAGGNTGLAEVAVQSSEEEEGKIIPSFATEIARDGASLSEMNLRIAAPQGEAGLAERVPVYPAVAGTDETPAVDATRFNHVAREEGPIDEGLDYIETDKVTETDLPPVSTLDEVSLADEPPRSSPADGQLATNEEPKVRETETFNNNAIEEAAPQLDIDALAESTKETVVSVPIVDSDFGWAEIQEPLMPVMADPNVPDPIDHIVEGLSPDAQPIQTDKPPATVEKNSAMPETAEEPAPASAPPPITQVIEAGPSNALPVGPRSLKPTDGLFTPAELVDGLPADGQSDNKHSHPLTHLTQAFFWPGSPPAYFGSSAFDNSSGASSPKKAYLPMLQPFSQDLTLRLGQLPFSSDPNNGVQQDVFGKVQTGDGPGDSAATPVNDLPSPTSTIPETSPSLMAVSLTRRPTDPHILSSDPYPYCLSTPGASVYFGSDKVSGESTGADTDKGEGTSAEKAEPISHSNSAGQSSKRKREASSQRGKGRKSSKINRRKSQASENIEPEVLGDEVIVVKSRPKEAERARKSSQRFPSELSQGSHASSGASLARQVQKSSSRASSIASSAPSIGTQLSPTINKPHVLSRPPQLPQATLLHAHGSKRKALAQAMSQPPMKTQSNKLSSSHAQTAPQKVQRTSPTTPSLATVSVPSSSFTTSIEAPSDIVVPAEQKDSLSTAGKVTPSPARQMSLPTFSTSSVTRSTRSHCRYHRISLPKEEGGPRVCFLVPGCSLNDKELMEEEEIVDHGDATQEDSQRMISDIESLGFGLELIGVMRQLVGLDILRENEVFYLPQPGEEVHQSRRYLPRTSTLTRQGVKDPSSHTDSPDYSGSFRSSISNRPPDSTSTSVSVVRRLVDSEKGSTIASTASESETTEDEAEPASKKHRPSPPEGQDVMGPPSTQPTEKKKRKGRRSKKVDLTYQPENEPEEQSDGEPRKLRKSTALRGVKRARASEVAAAPGDKQVSKRLKSHPVASDSAP